VPPPELEELLPELELGPPLEEPPPELPELELDELEASEDPSPLVPPPSEPSTPMGTEPELQAATTRPRDVNAETPSDRRAMVNSW